MVIEDEESEGVTVYAVKSVGTVLVTVGPPVVKALILWELFVPSFVSKVKLPEVK